jgi:tricorn protease
LWPENAGTSRRFEGNFSGALKTSLAKTLVVAVGVSRYAPGMSSRKLQIKMRRGIFGKIFRSWLQFILIAAFLFCFKVQADSGITGTRGYYRFPTIYGDTIVFTAEGDLWRVGIQGGVAERLTAHAGEETRAAFSPDGRILAFSAEYEGPEEVYTMPADGGLPVRQTYEGEHAVVVGWTPDGKVLYTTRHFSTLPNWQLAEADPKTGVTAPVPLSQASDGVFTPDGKTLYFTRQAFQGSHTKRYKGGTVQSLWKYVMGSAEATPLTANFAGTSKRPMWWKGRVYFISDRDGTMNLWSMNPDGGDLKQLTHHNDWDVKDASLSDGRIVYQLGADLYLYDITSGKDSVIPITLASDFDQEQEKWISKPMDYLTSVHISPHGNRIVLTARGQVFVAPADQGRFVDATRQQGIRYRQARFMPDGKSLVALSDATHELEFDQIPANGIGDIKQLTHHGKIFRFDGIPSPDGKWIVYQDKNQILWLFNLKNHKTRKIAISKNGDFEDLHWSPDSQWLAYVATANNLYTQIWLYHLKDKTTTALTSDRVNSYSPAWSTDGKWIYFLSERHFQSLVSSPWGAYEPEPYFDDMVQIYLVSLRKGGRSPFTPSDELHSGNQDTNSPTASKTKKAKKDKSKNQKSETKNKKSEEATNQPPAVVIDLDGLQERTQRVPVPPGNYSDLSVGEKQLYWLATGTGPSSKTSLMMLSITNKDEKPKVYASDVNSYELCLDRKKMLIRTDDNFHVVDAGAGAPVNLDKSVDLSNWTFYVKPRDEWREMFLASWRLMRDYFYDPQMNGVNWPAMRDKYLPLVARVTDREELSDLIGDMVGELSALHVFVFGGDIREGPEHIEPSSLGAELVHDQADGGYRIKHIYLSDPNYPSELSPLAKPGVDLTNGDIIQMINGVSLTTVDHPAALLRDQAGKQVLLSVKAPGASKSHEVIVRPISMSQEDNLRYDDWEYTRRLEVNKLSDDKIGYVHLRAMGAADIDTWAREFYPVFNRKGLIIDVRHNQGGNIDSWILEKLLRKAWFYWQGRAGNPTWSMQYAFRGHMVVLCDAHTASDGETFTEGFRRLGLGKIIGTRTWGGQIWLSFDNWLEDKGIASAPEYGVYGPTGKKWLIEGHGVNPDIVVDDLPHATFEGHDAQLDAAVKYLLKQIKLHPVPKPPPHPPYPDKAYK